MLQPLPFPLVGQNLSSHSFIFWLVQYGYPKFLFPSPRDFEYSPSWSLLMPIISASLFSRASTRLIAFGDRVCQVTGAEENIFILSIYIFVLFLLMSSSSISSLLRFSLLSSSLLSFLTRSSFCSSFTTATDG